jgi:hypothetical protein
MFLQNKKFFYTKILSTAYYISRRFNLFLKLLKVMFLIEMLIVFLSWTKAQNAIKCIVKT